MRRSFSARLVAFSTAIVCLTVGLPEEVCHAAGCHSGEGELVKRSLHVTIVHYADEAWWASLRVAGQQET